MAITSADGEPLIVDDHGRPLARFHWRAEGGEYVVRGFAPMSGISPDRAARQAVRDLPGHRMTTLEEEVARALIGVGCTLLRAATDMERDVTAPIATPSLPTGWSLIRHGWDDDLTRALGEAYGPAHPDTGDRVGSLRRLMAGDRGLVFLPGASARLRGPDGRSAGQVFTVGPVPWGSGPMSWVLDLAVGPAAQGRGFGAALLAYAMSGTRDAGLPVVGLTVTDSNPARRLYDKMGFHPTQRHFAVRAPAARGVGLSGSR